MGHGTRSDSCFLASSICGPPVPRADHFGTASEISCFWSGSGIADLKCLRRKSVFFSWRITTHVTCGQEDTCQSILRSFAALPLKPPSLPPSPRVSRGRKPVFRARDPELGTFGGCTGALTRLGISWNDSSGAFHATGFI